METIATLATTLTAPSPTFSFPSISSGAVLIDLSISTWTGRKQDKRAANAVEAQNNTAVGVANVTKKLLGDCEELSAVQKFAANARNTHYAMTTPWSDLGMRLCTLPMYMGTPTRDGYEKTMSTLEQEFWRLVNNFLDAYEWELGNAQIKLGSLFNADEYPTRDKLQEKFKFRFSAVPMPTAGDWRIDINNEAAVVLKESYEKYYSQRIQQTVNDIWQRVHKSVVSMIEGLDRHGLLNEKGNKQKFNDSMVDNVREMVDMMSMFNITNDPVMADAQRRLTLALDGVTPDALREDVHLRAETRSHVAEVKKIIDSLPGLGF